MANIDWSKAPVMRVERSTSDTKSAEEPWPVSGRLSGLKTEMRTRADGFAVDASDGFDPVITAEAETSPEDNAEPSFAGDAEPSSEGDTDFGPDGNAGEPETASVDDMRALRLGERLDPSYHEASMPDTSAIEDDGFERGESQDYGPELF